MNEAVGIAIRHRANLLLAELAGAALKHDATVRVTPANVGRTWEAIMATEHINFEMFEA